MKTTLFFLCMFFISPSPTIHAQEGGSVSGGGADLIEHLTMNAWFTSSDLEKAVKACIRVSPEFNFTAARLKAMTEKAFQTWADYYRSTGALNRAPDPKNWDHCSYPEAGKTGERRGYRMATHLTVSETCTGDEDLTLYFGVTTPDIQARKTRYHAPFAFAELLDFIPKGANQAAWSKGMIWIAPSQAGDSGYSWNRYQGAPLELTLLHEFGHVFGNEGNIDGTIMDRTIPRVIQTWTLKKDDEGFFDPLYLSIDRTNALVFTPEHGLNLRLSSSVNLCNNYDDYCKNRNRDHAQAVYKILTGSELREDTFRVTLEKPEFPLPNLSEKRRSFKQLMQAKLKFEADGVETILNFKPSSISTRATPPLRVFQEGCRYQQHRSLGIGGILIQPSGQEKPMILNLNSTHSQIEFIDPDFSESNDFCMSYANEEIPCTLLLVDYAFLRAKANHLLRME